MFLMTDTEENETRKVEGAGDYTFKYAKKKSTTKNTE